ncbi:hypothetical protein SCUCBS95973_005470 [Sporothrix curviconia]|uniref:CID domain-containing protein n=1 Tax=Sporothrix curviconia TaxID=1260050 RepID=A0ABP0BXA2_9PEZI
MPATSAAAELAIAKASLTAVLLRPDPAPCPRADIDEFARQLTLTAARCSPANVQTCKRWMLQHVTPSSARTAAVGRYLVALANSFSPTAPTSTKRADKSTKETSSRRKRLHLLYIINDVLFHVTFRSGHDNGRTKSPFTTSIEPFLEPLVSSVAAFVRAPKQLAKIRSLLDLWAEKHYVADNVLARLRTAVDEGPRLAEEKLQKDREGNELQKTSSASASVAAAAAPRTGKEAPFLLPALHGDPSTPWYDLPAANWLAVLEPNSTRPMNPAALKPLQMTPGPAPPALVASVQALLADVNRMFCDDGEAGAGDHARNPGTSDTIQMDSDVDALGEHIEIDVLSGDITGGDTYYGWSRAFCKSMKERQRRRQRGHNDPDLDLPDADHDNRGRRQDNRGDNKGQGQGQGRREDDSQSSSLSSPKPAFKKRPRRCSSTQAQPELEQKSQ